MDNMANPPPMVAPQKVTALLGAGGGGVVQPRTKLMMLHSLWCQKKKVYNPCSWCGVVNTRHRLA